MSRFWAAGDDVSTSSDDSSDASSSDASSSIEEVRRGGAGENRWIMSDDSDSEDEVRVVKSAKDRAYETFEGHISKIRAAMKSNDWITIQSEYDDLQKAIIKSKTLLAKQGGIPRIIIRILCDLEDLVTKCSKDKAYQKKLKPKHVKALNRMKLTVTKYKKEYDKVMTEYRKNPEASSSEDEDEDDEDDSDEDDSEDDDDEDEEEKVTVKSKKEKPPPVKKVSSESDSDDSSDESSSESESEEESEESSSEESSSSSSSSEESDDDDDDDDDEDWASSDKSDSESSDSSAGAYAELKGRARWLKKNTVVKKKEVKSKEEKAKLRLESKAQRDKEAAQLALERESQSITKSILPVESLTPTLLNNKVKEIISLRGRKNTNKEEVVRQLEALSRLSLTFDNPRVEVPILMHLITAQFDLQRTIDDFMDIKIWKSCARHLSRISNFLVPENKWRLGVMSADEVANDMMLLAHKGNIMKSVTKDGGEGAVNVLGQEEKLVNPHTGGTETKDERDERIRLEKEAAMSTEEYYKIRVVGSLASFITRLDEEYFKSLQRISPHTIEYVMRLRDEGSLVSLLTKIQNYYTSTGEHSSAAELAALRVEHLYYRHDSIAKEVDKATLFYSRYGEMGLLHPASVGSVSDEADKKYIHPAALLGKPSVDDETIDNDYSSVINTLCTYVYKYGSDRSRTRAMLCHIFHHALHDRFYDAKDLLLMSHLQDTISQANDVSTMILFNRMMVTLGLSAFRLGKIWDAHQCLSDICSSRVRELLAQGVSLSSRYPNQDKTAEQEKAEKRRLIPYHQHIHLDLLEAVHLTCAMLLEIPNLAYQTSDTNPDTRRKVISRTFRKHFDIYDRQVFVGPPEQTRDYIVCASKFLILGDWKACADLVTSLEVWQLVPGDNSAEKIKEMLTAKIKVEGLRTYLFAFSHQYDSMSLDLLCKMFDLTKNEVHCVVSKMIINSDLAASLDQTTETIVLRKAEPSQLQILALQFADKALGLVEANERLLDAKSGGAFGYIGGSGKDDRDWKRDANGPGKYDNRDAYSGNTGGYHGYHNRNQSNQGGKNSGRRSNNRDRFNNRRRQYNKK